MKNSDRLWHTVRHLKYTQVYYQIRNRVLPSKKLIQPKNNTSGKFFPINLIGSNVQIATSSNGKYSFTFLNISHSFRDNIDWNYSKYGKLWTYNLTYFDFLNRDDIDKEYGLSLILNYINESDSIQDGYEPYPISLRCINWIKFLSRYEVEDNTINNSIFSQYQYLLNNLEYHLLGNHLLENAFSLLLGSYYLKNEKFYNKAKSLLQKELKEQILEDGGHFELSPMYHKILLFRLLDSINTVANNRWKNDALNNFLKQKAQLMLGWLEAITYSNGTTPNVNDSADEIAPSTADLVNYAKKLNLNWKRQKLKNSGYRLFREKSYELLVDIGKIGPDYIPGHAHADTFNFELMVDGQPIIVDTGISTYEKNHVRQSERSTFAHNTVIVDGKNQSDVWGGFRVGKRAKIINLEESNGFIKASHNGYKGLGITHTRSFQINKSEIIINDLIEQKSNQEYTLCSLLHFHPNVSVSKVGPSLLLTNPTLEIIFSGATKIEIEEFDYCEGFNKTKASSMALIYFNKSLTTKILVK